MAIESKSEIRMNCKSYQGLRHPLFLPTKIDQVEGWRWVTQASKKTAHLAAMMGAMIDHVKDQLPERLLPGTAFHVAVGDFSSRLLVGETRGPGLPAFHQGRPADRKSTRLNS